MIGKGSQVNALVLVLTIIVTGVVIFGFNIKHNLILTSVFYTCAGLIPFIPALLKDGGESANSWMEKHAVISTILIIIWLGFIIYFAIETANGNIFN